MNHNNFINVDPNAYIYVSRDNPSKNCTNLHVIVYYIKEYPEYRDQLNYILENMPEELNKKNDDNQTAINIAITTRFFNINTVKLLLKYNPDLSIADEYDHTPLDNAILKKNKKLIILLLEHGANINNIKMMELIRYKTYNKIIKYLIGHNYIDLNIKDNNNMTIYDHAVMHDNHDIANYILDADALNIKQAL